jgi:RimJ/RimL family protein N-acetyltransferase
MDRGDGGLPAGCLSGSTLRSMRKVVPPEPPLSRGGVVLRPPLHDDRWWIAEACSDPEMKRWIPHLPEPYSEADASAHIQYALRHWGEGTGAVFVIEEVQGRAVGMIELHLDATDVAMASVGYWLARNGRGRGAATTALQLVSGWATVELGIVRVNLTTDPENHASQAVAERAGFRREGLLRAWSRVPGGRRDSVMFSFVRSDTES